MHVLIRQRVLSHSPTRSTGLYLNLLAGLMGPAFNKPGQIPEYSPPLERVSPLLALLVVYSGLLIVWVATTKIWLDMQNNIPDLVHRPKRRLKWTWQRLLDHDHYLNLHRKKHSEMFLTAKHNIQCILLLASLTIQKQGQRGMSVGVPNRKQTNYKYHNVC